MTVTAVDAERVTTFGSANRLRVLHVVASLGPGGMERTLSRLLASLASGPDSSTMQHAVAVLGQADVALVRKFASVAHVYQLRSHRRWGLAAHWLRRVIRSFDPRIVHARGTASWFDTTLATSGLTSVRRVLGFHGREQLDTPTWRQRSIMTWSARHADSIVTLSRESAGWIRELTQSRRHRLTVIPNGVDIGSLMPPTPRQRIALRDKLLEPRDRFLCVCVANLLPIKRIDLLLEAWRRVLMVMPDARLIIAGEGPQRKELQGQLSEVRLDGRATLIGAGIDIHELLCAADLFVLPSDYECCSNALLEAMAAGLPCVATQAGGNPEIINPHHNGWLVPPGNAPLLAETIVAALLNADARERIGRAARRDVLEHHRLDQMTRQYRDLYERLGRQEEEPSLDEEVCPCAG